MSAYTASGARSQVEEWVYNGNVQHKYKMSVVFLTIDWKVLLKWKYVFECRVESKLRARFVSVDLPVVWYENSVKFLLNLFIHCKHGASALHLIGRKRAIYSGEKWLTIGTNQCFHDSFKNYWLKKTTNQKTEKIFSQSSGRSKNKSFGWASMQELKPVFSGNWEFD